MIPVDKTRFFDWQVAPFAQPGLPEESKERKEAQSKDDFCELRVALTFVSHK
jgi:hypothetical protein